jgi:hypothetical protein
MRPFLCEILQCDKCKASKSFNLNPQEIVRVNCNYNNLNNFEIDNSYQDFMIDLINQLKSTNQNIIEIDEIDVQLFFEEKSAITQKIAELLFGIDVKTGDLECKNCQNKKNIRNSILIYDE